MHATVSKYSAATGKLYQPGERGYSFKRYICYGYRFPGERYTLHGQVAYPMNIGRNAAKRARKARGF